VRKQGARTKKKMRKKSEEKTLEQINASEVYTAGAK